MTPLVSGNGAYVIVGLPVGPLPPASYAVNDSEGASLVVVYSEPGAPARVITINDGAVTLMGSRVQAYATTLRGFVAANPPTGFFDDYTVEDGINEAARIIASHAPQGVRVDRETQRILREALEHARWRTHGFLPEACHGCEALRIALSALDRLMGSAQPKATKGK